MKKLHLLKTLLVAVCLLMGGVNLVWGQVETIVYSQDFENSENFNVLDSYSTDRATVSQQSRQVGDATSKYMKVVSAGNGTTVNYTAFAASTSYTSSEKYRIEFDFGMTSIRNTTSQTQTFHIYAGANSLIRFTNTTSSSSTSTTANVFLGSNETSDGTIAINNSVAANPTTFYHATISASSEGTTITLDDGNNPPSTYNLSANFVVVTKLAYATGKTFGAWAIDDMSVTVISDEEIVPEPEASITGVSGINRIVTMTLGDGSSDGTVIKYYTDTESKSDLTTYSTPFSVTSSSTIYYYAESASGAKSGEKSISVTCEAIQLNSPTISRTANNTVTITDNQSNLDGSPTSTIYYSYDGDPIKYTGAITIAADATITAYATATGYTNSSIVSRDVALFPTSGLTQIVDAPENNTYSSASLTGDDITGTNATFKALTVDGVQWGGENVFVQSTNFGYRNGGNGKDWYINSTSDTWILIKNMKAGDIIVVNSGYQASNLENATYTEKYSIANSRAYTVISNGDVEMAFKKPNSGTMHYFYGLYAYTCKITGTAIGATDNSTAYLGASTTQVVLNPGDTYNYQFINYNNGSGLNWQNWVLPVYDASANRVLTLRADWYEDQNGTTVAEHQRGFSSNASNYWDNVPSKMNGATVDMTVSFTKDKTFVMESSVSYNGTTWTYNYTSENDNNIDLTGNNYVKVALSVSKSWLDLLSEGKTAVGAKVGATGYTTFASAEALDLANMPNGLQAFYASSVGETSVKFKEVTEAAEAGTGLLLKGTANTYYSIPVVASGSAVSGNLLVGCTTATTLDVNANYYVMVNNGGIAEFQCLDVQGATIPAGKAYLNAGGAGARLSFSFDDDNTTTGIRSIDNGQLTGGNSVYNLNGQRVDNPKKGLYIVNGKKYINK